MSNQAKIQTIASIKTFVYAGNATFTIASLKTNTRFTYKVVQKDDGKVFFVQVMIGSDNESSYSYLGFIRGKTYKHGGDKAKIAIDDPRAVAFEWFKRMLDAGTLPPTLQVYHAGRCGRCNRKLTVPSSIESGLGPECATKEGFFAVAA